MVIRPPFTPKPGVEQAISLGSEINGALAVVGDTREPASRDLERADKSTAHDQVEESVVYAATFSPIFSQSSTIQTTRSNDGPL
jgi:hypothetical protein